MGHSIHDIARELAALTTMTVAELRTRYIEVFGEDTHSRNRDYLRKKVGYRIQELAEGGLSERSRRRIGELVESSPLRQRGALPSTASSEPLARAAPPSVQERASAAVRSRDARLPPPGSILRRSYRGTVHEVLVRDTDFVWNGQTFDTLSGVAAAITGAHWNGLRFFALTKESAA